MRKNSDNDRKSNLNIHELEEINVDEKHWGNSIARYQDWYAMISNLVKVT